MIRSKVHYVTCNCFSPDHTMRFCYDGEMEGDELCWAEVQLHQYRSFWARVVVAVRYIFGYESRYGHWDCTTIDLAEGRRLRNFLNAAIAEKENSMGDNDVQN